MKLAEALLQDKPIKRKDFALWYKPELLTELCSNHSCGINLLVLQSVTCDAVHFVNAVDFKMDTWEIKPMTLGEKILEIMRDHTRSAENALSDIRYVIESGNYE